jgi:hypothetical protein
VATVAGAALAEVCRVMGTREETHAADLVGALDALGLEAEWRRGGPDDGELSVVMHRWPDEEVGHWTVWDRGEWYDPATRYDASGTTTGRVVVLGRRKVSREAREVLDRLRGAL